MQKYNKIIFAWLEKGMSDIPKSYFNFMTFCTNKSEAIRMSLKCANCFLTGEARFDVNIFENKSLVFG